jgi:hypothetical protein
MDFNGILNFNLIENPGDYGWLPVVYGSQPAYDRYTEKVEAIMTLGDGQVNVTFVKRGMTQDEINVIWPVPTQVSAAQACIILDEDGLLDEVDAIVAASPRAIQIWYQRANYWERNNENLLSLASLLSLTETQLDDMFRRAARVT